MDKLKAQQEDNVMQESNTVFRCSSFVESQLRDPQVRDVKSLTPFVTISRQAGSGAHHISNMLAEILNKKQINPARKDLWKVYDQDLVSKVVEDHDLSRKVADYMPEDTVNEFNSTLEEMLGLHPSSNELVVDTSLTIRMLAREGNSILIGRGAHIVTRGLRDGVHIRLIGSINTRTTRFAIENRVSSTRALSMIKKRDHARTRYLKYYYNQDIDDPTFYDMVINTDTIDTSAAAALIATLLCCRTSTSTQ